MGKNKNIDEYLNIIVNEQIYSNQDNLKYEMEWLFHGLDVKNKNILDIGGGSGVVSFYASQLGAGNVICLEPEAEGSSSEMQNTFRKLQIQLSATNVILDTSTIQTFISDGQAFDIILLNNSVNHLNESACINLHKDENSRAIYKSIFVKLYSLSNHGARIIICDCSRYNFFALLKIRNPFSPTIEWNKHQSPELWSNLLDEVGFAIPIIRWSSFNRLRSLGRLFTGNKIIAYFLKSYFCLSMIKE